MLRRISGGRVTATGKKTKGMKYATKDLIVSSRLETIEASMFCLQSYVLFCWVGELWYRVVEIWVSVPLWGYIYGPSRKVLVSVPRCCPLWRWKYGPSRKILVSVLRWVFSRVCAEGLTHRTAFASWPRPLPTSSRRPS